jgi:GNAT superfamily N-acetyltransferase
MLRPAVAADLARLIEIRDAAGADALSDAAAIGSDELARLIDAATVTVYEDSGSIVGFSAVDCARGAVAGLLVETGHRGKGAGRQLLAIALATIKDAGHRQATLMLPLDAGAARHYLNNGWIAAGGGENGELVLQITL